MRLQEYGTDGRVSPYNSLEDTGTANNTASLSDARKSFDVSHGRTQIFRVAYNSIAVNSHHLLARMLMEGRFVFDLNARDNSASRNLYVKQKLYTDDILIHLRAQRWLRCVLVRDVRNLIMAHTRGIASSCLCKDDTHLTFLTYTMPNIYRVALLQRWNYIITSTSCIYAYIWCSSAVC